MNKEEFIQRIISELRPYFSPMSEFKVQNMTYDDGQGDYIRVFDPLLTIIPSFDIEDIYGIFLQESSIKPVAEYCYINFLDCMGSGLELTSWDAARSLVTLRIAGLFEPDPYDYMAKLDWNSFTVFFQIEGQSANGDFTICVTNKLLGLWGIGIESLFKEALSNTALKYKPFLLLGEEQDDPLSLEPGAKIPGAVHELSDTVGDEDTGKGLRCILYGWLLRAISDEIGSFYILPVDTGLAVLVTDTGRLDADSMFQILFMDTSEVPIEDRVSATILRYDADTKELERII